MDLLEYCHEAIRARFDYWQKFFHQQRLERERQEAAAKSDCPTPQGGRCTCGNGIGCIHVPYDQW